jgi:hypothetical protein
MVMITVKMNIIRDLDFPPAHLSHPHFSLMSILKFCTHRKSVCCLIVNLYFLISEVYVL